MGCNTESINRLAQYRGPSPFTPYINNFEDSNLINKWFGSCVGIYSLVNTIHGPSDNQKSFRINLKLNRINLMNDFRVDLSIESPRR